jgi:hypothetical protein
MAVRSVVPLPHAEPKCLLRLLNGHGAPVGSDPHPSAPSRTVLVPWLAAANVDSSSKQGTGVGPEYQGGIEQRRERLEVALAGGAMKALTASRWLARSTSGILASPRLAAHAAARPLESARSASCSGSHDPMRLTIGSGTRTSRAPSHRSSGSSSRDFRALSTSRLTRATIVVSHPSRDGDRCGR